MVRFPTDDPHICVDGSHHTHPPHVLRFVAGIYFVLFCSSLKLLLNKRKTVSSVTPLLAFAGVLAALITWVSSRCRHTTSGDRF
jgi:hypothetical protein